MRTRLHITFFILLFAVFNVSALDKFSNNKEDFLREMEEFISTSQKQSTIAAFKEFKKLLNTGVYEEQQVDQIIDVCNGMLERKMSASPYFEAYLTAANAMTSKNIKASSDWHTCLQGLLDNIVSRKFKDYKTFLDFSYHFFEKKTLRHSTSGISWLADSKEYKFIFKDKTAQLTFEQTNLEATRKGKSITINQTTGSYNPLTLTWTGKGGQVDWTKHELEGVYCEFADYTINTKKGFYEAKGASMTYPKYFKTEKIEGDFQDKLVFDNSGSYPKFDSKQKDLEINEIGEGIKYKGGFSMYGKKIYGKGTKEQQATLEIYNNQQKLTLRTKGETFVINDEARLSGENLNTTIYFKNDSISHASSAIIYDVNTKNLNMSRGGTGKEQTSFSSSFHQMDIEADNIDWKIDTDSIMIGHKGNNFMGANKNVSFKSSGYYDEAEYLKLQNMSTVHPLAILVVMEEQNQTDNFDADFYAYHLNRNFTEGNITSLLYDLVAKGFIDYDKDTKKVSILEKTRRYVKAHQKQTDYDGIELKSKASETHAVLDLSSNSMVTNGVSKVELSSKQDVAFLPENEQVVIKENRDMDFDGKVFAGHSSMIGKDYHFDYEMNSIQMDSVRYFDLFMPDGSKDKGGNKKSFSIASRIEHASGTLLIDAPSNKSGQDDLESFPSFNTNKNSYVYYDLEDTQNGVYSRENFYFELDPFHFNNLDNYGKEDIHFKGTMKSEGIFPDFKETLILQEDDHSLGFTTQTKGSGYALYSKGNYTGEIDLSNKGLLGKGKVEYLGANIQSEDIAFRPEQMTASARKFDLTENRVGNIQVPQVVGTDVSIDWQPQKDSMYVDSQKEAFKLFKAEEHELNGTLILTPNGLKGKGKFDWDMGIMTSKSFSFGANSTKADTTNLRIKTKGLQTDAMAFDSKNVNGDVDFDKQIGTFKANHTDSETAMPYNKYVTNLGDFIWDMKKETITFTSEEEGVFTSIDPAQDSLSFHGKSAFYDVKNSTLKIGGVPHIQSADALIHPAAGDVLIKPGGAMDTIRNAKIIANITNKNHVINRATVAIKGKKEYVGRGYYEYNIADKKQEITFNDIVGAPVGKGKRSKKKMVTRAKGEVKEIDKFYIDRKTKFQGIISLDAESKNLFFDGFAQFDTPLLPRKQWFAVKSEGDKENLVISYDTPKSIQGVALSTGLFVSRETARVYPNIMMTASKRDRAILDVKGAFKYDYENDIFLFGDSSKVALGTQKGNLLTFNNADASIKGEGSFNLGPQLVGTNVKAAGHAVASFEKTDDCTLELLAGVNIPLPESLMRIITADISSSSFNANDINYTKPEKYVNPLAEFYDDPVALKEATANMLSYRDLSMPKETNTYNFVFSELPMKWDADYQSFMSTSPKIGLVSVAGQNINKQIQAYIEFKMKSNGEDSMYIYIKSPSDYYYFISYKNGIIGTTSSNNKYNQTILDLKKKELFPKVKGDDTAYEVQALDQSAAQQFIKRIQTTQ